MLVLMITSLSCEMPGSASLTEVHYDTESLGMVGIGVPANSAGEISVRYAGSVLTPQSGKKLTKVRVYWSSGQPNYLLLRIRSAGTAAVPGGSVYEQVVSSVTLNDWNVIPLTTPVTVPAADLWIGFYITSPASGSSGIMLDSGPAVSTVNYLYMPYTWTDIVTAYAYTGNLKIRGIITGS